MDDGSTSSSLEGAGQDISDPYSAAFDGGPSGLNRSGKRSLPASFMRFRLESSGSSKAGRSAASLACSKASPFPSSPETIRRESTISRFAAPISWPAAVRTRSSEMSTTGSIPLFQSAAKWRTRQSRTQHSDRPRLLGSRSRHNEEHQGERTLDGPVPAWKRSTSSTTPISTYPIRTWFTLAANGGALPNPVAGQIMDTVNVPL